MNVKKFILSCLTVAAAFSVNAQETKNEYVPNWYVQGQFGGQHTVGEVAFTDLNSLNAQIGFGYNFNELWGARFTLNGWKSKAGWDSFDRVTQVHHHYKWAWNYVSPMIDATFNLGNMIMGYNPERLVNFGVFAGLGANIAFNNTEANSANEQIKLDYNFTRREGLRCLWSGTKTRFTGRVGANVDFRINNNLRAGLEIHANAINDYYNSKRAGTADWYLNALVGIKYTFGSSNKTSVVPVVVPVEKLVEDKVNQMVNTELEDLLKRIEELEECCADSKKAVVQAAEASKAVVEAMRRDIFFNISCNIIQPSEMVKIKEVADFMKKNPNAVVEVTGYADKGTGNPTINEKYASKRATTVKNALVSEGVSESRIIVDSMGDKVQPYSDPILNRVAICIIK